MWPKVLAAAAVFAAAAGALAPAPVSLDASEWIGIDGNWSTVQFLIGSQSTNVSVLVSTALSEFMVVGSGGCLQKEPHCIDARGGVYSPSTSKHWSSIGLFEYPLTYLGTDANSQYGLDTVNFYSPVTNLGVGMSNVLLSVVNTTDVFTGFFGLGVVQSRFKGKHVTIAQSPLTMAVHTFGWIPSYSYGFTAGAHYRNTPASVTLGGYDSDRFTGRDVDFTVGPDGLPRPLVRGIQVSASNGADKPHGWDSQTKVLSNFNNSFTTIIDSTTSYLWLPESVCDEFAEALDLTYDPKFEVYTVTNEQYNKYSQSDDMTFTFTLSSFDNHNNFGYPLSIPDAVNITLPLKAFIGLLQYPFHNEAIKYGDPAVPYFMLKKQSPDVNSTAILGRAFLQEAYLITKYDSGTFSVHQAKFSDDPLNQPANLVAIPQSKNSAFPPPPKPSRHGLTTPEMAGIAVGIIAFCMVCLLGWLMYHRMNKNKARREKAVSVMEENQDSSSTLNSDSPKTPVARILSRITRRKRSPRSGSDTTDPALHPSEAPDSEIYELPAPVPPVELDCGGDDHSMLGETEMGTDSTHHLSAYELARRKLDRQLAGPVPEYSPPENGIMPPPEKMIHDVEPAAQVVQLSHHDRISPITPGFPPGIDSNSLPSVPSPISPRTTDWNSHSTDLPSPITAPRSNSSGTGSRLEGNGSIRSGPSDLSATRSNSNATAPASPSSLSLPMPPASYQRTPIDPSKVVCLGPLPENIQAPRLNLAHHALARDFPPGQFNVASHASEGSLGSNFTDEEDDRIEEMTRQASVSPIRPSGTTVSSIHSAGERRLQQISTQSARSLRHQTSRNAEPDSPSSQERIDSGNELIHVPQMAEKRYSWEEERQ